METEENRVGSLRSYSKDINEQYIGLLWKKLAFGFFIFLSLCLVFIFSLGVGSLELSMTEIIKGLLNRDNGEFGHVIWNIRLARAVAASIAGAGLAVTGAIIQNVLRNPLASPFTIGISQGAAFGAAFAIIVLGAGQTHITGNEMVTVKNPYIITSSAFLGSILSVVFILSLSYLKRVSPESVILAGVALSAFFGAATMFLQYFASDIQVAATVFWTFGDIGKAGWKENLLMLFAFVLPFFYFVSIRWDLNALQWGDETAQSLGVGVHRLRILSMILCSAVVAVITSFLGIIGFVGLISPHILRLIIGGDYRFLIPYSAFFGALFLLVSDIIARTILAPVVLPVGIITSFAGVPMFLYLLIKMRGT